VTRTAQLILGLLAVATLCAIVAAQRAKDAPALVRRVTVTALFTPNGDGYRDVARIRFTLGRPDTVDVAVLDGRGATVRRLAVARPAPGARAVRLRWDGRTDRGVPAPPGTYRVRVALRRRGRTLELQRPTRLSPRPAHGRGAPGTG
jgi:hypothetical protein